MIQDAAPAPATLPGQERMREPNPEKQYLELRLPSPAGGLEAAELAKRIRLPDEEKRKTLTPPPVPGYAPSDPVVERYREVAPRLHPDLELESNYSLLHGISLTSPSRNPGNKLPGIPFPGREAENPSIKALRNMLEPSRPLREAMLLHTIRHLGQYCERCDSDNERNIQIPEREMLAFVRQTRLILDCGPVDSDLGRHTLSTLAKAMQFLAKQTSTRPLSGRE